MASRSVVRAHLVQRNPSGERVSVDSLHACMPPALLGSTALMGVICVRRIRTAVAEPSASEPAAAESSSAVAAAAVAEAASHWNPAVSM
jgi:hypothetical protein